MGIDAEMFVKLNYKISDEELRNKSYIFGSMFHNYLMLGHEATHYNNPLEKVEEIQGDGDGEGYQFYSTTTYDLINIPIAGRYYGVGYERGPLMDYVAMAIFLEQLFPNQEVYYGGDSSGVPFILFDVTARTLLIEHAVKVAHEPYQRSFDAVLAKNETGPDCPHCKVSMIKNGHGGNYARYTCLGCGWNVVIKDNKKTEGYNLAYF